MNNTTRAIIVAAVVAAAAGAFYFKDGGEPSDPLAVSIDSLGDAVETAESETVAAVSPEDGAGKARLLCFGAERCVPCRMMVPVRKALSEAYPDTLHIRFVDVWQDRAAGAQHNIRMIPTAIFMNADGEEVYRQEGFMDKEAIVAKFKEFGITLE